MVARTLAVAPPTPPCLSQASHATAESRKSITQELSVTPTMIDKTEADGGLQYAEGLVEHSRIPRVRLGVDVINDATAARLATSFVGHVLFLKNQVPFPVMQLGRIPCNKSNTRASKKRNELLSSFDTLSSHLSTTFTALSTALARSKPQPHHPRSSARELDQINAELRMADNRAIPRTGRGYLVILVGAGVGSAKSKVVFAVDGLEVKIWGTRDDLPAPGANDVEGDEENTSGEDEDEDDSDEDESNDEGDGEESGEESSEDEEDEDSDAESTDGSQASPAPRMDEGGRTPWLPTPPSEDEQALRVADRLLSRTLAAADGEGNSMASEIAPTQTHILLRAPRRFVHPSWIPRQNLSTSLDGVLQEFLEESKVLGNDGGIVGDNHKKRKTGVQVEGVWIGRKGENGIDVDDTVGSDGPSEEDEMIWWGWEGKLTGFSEW